MFYPNILNPNQIELVKKLGFLKKEKIYLAGGTALALQLGHRSSVDFDFYKEEPLTQNLMAGFQKNVPGIIVSKSGNFTIFARSGETDISVFNYPYKLLSPLQDFEGIYLASIPDIAAMKVAAIIQRGKRRDFIDIFYLLQKYSIEEIIKFTEDKFPGYQTVMAMKALAWFKDAEEEEELSRGIVVLDKTFSWDEAKKKIYAEVEKYQLRIVGK